MKRLCVFDLDGTIMNTPEPEEGKKIWKQKTGNDYPHKGWWGRKESLDTDVFDIKPFPEILKKLEDANEEKDTHVIILTARQEKLTPEIENILNLNNICVDELIAKKGPDDKGDVIMKFIENNPDLEQIVVYDDFAGGMEHKIKQLTGIEDKIPENIDYQIYNVKDGKVDKLIVWTNILEFVISDEIKKFS